MRVVLGVSGGIAAYKAAMLLRLFRERGDAVTVVPTAAALEFVGAPTWEALSGEPVQVGVFEHVDQVRHVGLGQNADLVVVAPATADLLAKAATGLANDLLTNTLLAARCPVVMAPAMHTEMWEHPATRANVATLRERGVHVIEPASGRLTGKDTGPGRLPEPDQIFAVALAVMNPKQDLAGRGIVITAGGTREPLDPVRFLGNRSSGKMGFALAKNAVRRGAHVTLITTIPPQSELAAVVDVIRVDTALEMREAVHAHADADVVIMAAAVADFRAKNVAGAKIKKTHGAGDDSAPVIELVRNPDILAELVANRSPKNLVIVGFAAETGDDQGSVLDHARAKLARKGCDILVANEVGENLTFGQDESQVHLLQRDSAKETTVGPAPKSHIAASILDLVSDRLPRQ